MGSCTSVPEKRVCSSTPSPIDKVIFAQRIFRFAGRTVKDLVIFNNVCKDFEETMQAHHTFNLVLFDNIIKREREPFEWSFCRRSLEFLKTAPAWIVFQWMTVNENDETQRSLLKNILYHQASEGQKILLRWPHLISVEEDPATTFQLFRHMLESCVKLGIIKQVLEVTAGDGTNVLKICITRGRFHQDRFKLLLESCVQHVDVKKLLEERDAAGGNVLFAALSSAIPHESFKLLIETCQQHADLKMMMEELHRNRSSMNCIMAAAASRDLGVESFKLLLDSAVQCGNIKMLLEHKDLFGQSCLVHAAANSLPFASIELLIEYLQQYGDLNKMLEETNSEGCTIIKHSAAQRSEELDMDSLKLLIAHFPSNESFQSTFTAEDDEGKSASDYATSKELRTFLQDPYCWAQCREWLSQITKARNRN